MFRLGFVGSIFTTGVVTGQAVNDANRVNRQTPDQLLVRPVERPPERHL